MGIPEGFNWRTARSPGLRLVVSLGEQVQGTVKLYRSEGTKFKIIVRERE
jgi:two-component sensor histidine kinase